MSDVARLFSDVYRGAGMIGLIVFGTGLLLMIGLYEVLRTTLVARVWAGKPLSLKWIAGGGRLSDDEDHTLSTDTIFSRYDSWIKHRIPMIDIKCPLRQKIFTAMLTIMLSTRLELLKQIVESPVEQMTDEDFRVMWETMFNRYEFEWHKRCDERGVDPAIMRAYDKKHAVIERIIEGTVMDLCSSLQEGSGLVKMQIILDVISGMEASTVLSLSQTLDHLNGIISNTTFDGMVCQHCPVCVSGESGSRILSNPHKGVDHV